MLAIGDAGARLLAQLQARPDEPVHLLDVERPVAIAVSLARAGQLEAWIEAL